MFERLSASRVRNNEAATTLPSGTEEWCAQKPKALRRSNLMAGTMFGIGTPNPYAISAGSWGLSPYGSVGQGIGVQQPWQQILQLVQIVPQQLQQVQALQQQQLLYLQQLLQVVPAQLQQLQQLIQILPQQAQQLQPFQPLGQTLSGPLGFGLVPQVFAGQTPSHVM
jgi:hypothetical protein